MFKKILIVCGFVFTVQAWAVSVNETPDAGRTIPTAMILPTNTTSINGEIENGQDVDLFKFTLEAPATFTIEVLEVSPELDMNLLVFNALGQGLAGDDDDDNNCSPVSVLGERDSCLTLSLAAGDYFIAIGDDSISAFENMADADAGINSFLDDDSGINEGIAIPTETLGLVGPATGLPASNDVGFYTVNFSQFPKLANESPDAGRTIPTAMILPTNTTSINGEIENGQDVDLFKFTLEAPATFTIEVLEVSPELDMNLLVFNALGQGLAGDDDNDNNCTPITELGELDSCLTLSLVAGEYYIAIGDDSISAFENMSDADAGINSFLDDDSGINEGIGIPTETLGLVGSAEGLSASNDVGLYTVNFSQAVDFSVPSTTNPPSTTSSASTINAIPTLSVWGVMMLSIMLGGFGVYARKATGS